MLPTGICLSSAEKSLFINNLLEYHVRIRCLQKGLASIFLLETCSLYCLCFSAHVVSSLAYPNLLGTKRLGCCWKHVLFIEF
jgi:hypothetical protein